MEDSVLNQLNNQKGENNDNKQKKEDFLKVAYGVYHFIAEAFLSFLFVTLIVIIILYAIYFVDTRRNIRNHVTKAPLFGAYVIISPSMAPTIKVQDAIVIKRQEKEKLKKNDIITFYSTDPRYAGVIVTHRIIGIEKSSSGEIMYRTKGDNNNTPDATLVKYENIQGRVVLKIPKIGYIQHLLVSAFGWVFLVVIPCALIVIYDLIKLFKLIFKKKTPAVENKQEEIKEEKEDIEVL